MMRASGVVGGAPCALRWITQERRAALGHNSGSPDALCPNLPPLMLFFCVVNVSVINLVACGLPSVAVSAKMLQS